MLSSMAQRRQQRLVLCELALRGQQIDARDRALLQGAVHEIDIALVLGKDVFGCADLRTRRRDRKRLQNDVAGE